MKVLFSHQYPKLDFHKEPLNEIQFRNQKSNKSTIIILKNLILKYQPKIHKYIVNQDY